MKLRFWFLLPTRIVLALLLAVPLAIVCVYSGLMRGAYGGVTQPWTLENYTRFFDPLYGAILLRSLLMAGGGRPARLALRRGAFVAAAPGGRRGPRCRRGAGIGQSRHGRPRASARHHSLGGRGRFGHVLLCFLHSRTARGALFRARS